MDGVADLVVIALLGALTLLTAGHVLALRSRSRAVAAQAQQWADRIRADAENAARSHQDRLLAEAAAYRAALDRREQRIAAQEQRIERELRRLDAARRQLDERTAQLDQRAAELARLAEERRAVLEQAAALTAEEAKAALVADIVDQAKREAAVLVRAIERDARTNGEARARRIISLAIQRLAGEQTSESVVRAVPLPEEAMKGRIIGREGRNIRAFETVTGVDLIVDDTPGVVLLSCFHPLRRETARLTLEKLVADGRINPHRIEEAYEASRREVEQQCVRAGEDALLEVGISDMHPELVALLGQLRYRTSYGQNVLAHLVESAHLAGMMAAELGADVPLAKRCALLHDIGKALTHEVEGSHAVIGAQLARRYGECEEVAHAIEAHHNEVEARTVEAVLTQAADAISGGRPGARRASMESYVKRLQRMEEIAYAVSDGVEKVFVMQAGREIRVMVQPEAVDDVQAQVIARDIAKRVEEELTYPGQVRVTVIRESRAVETAR